ncbi:MAG: hypothetical protein VB070_07705 [Clostridiaceae bacterium]|nr:hypothetical protein [Clostridiaceae bacterium]
MNRPGRQTHLLAASLFSLLSLASIVYSQITGDGRWRVFSMLCLIAAVLAWLMYFRRKLQDASDHEQTENVDNPPSFPEGQAKLIDAGRLPNRYNPRIDLKEFEVCHFSVAAQRLLFAPLPDKLRIDPTRLAVRYSGGQYYYIVRPQEILLPAEPDDRIDGELVITNQRIIFLAAENGFEVPLQSLKLLDCSAHLVDFHVRDRRYTIQTEASCYAEKVLLLLLQPQN